MRTDKALSRIVDNVLRVASFAAVALLWLLSMQKMAFSWLQPTMQLDTATLCRISGARKTLLNKWLALRTKRELMASSASGSCFTLQCC